ncbi:hypothetical protein JHN49_02630 [Streptomyces sp. MBT57]|nr:hypothetical protein [Streptomyces sp. MBT57]
MSLNLLLEDLMIPPKTLLPTITPEGTYGQLVELITAVSELDDQAAEGLANSLLFRLGLYGPTPERVDDLCPALFFDGAPEEMAAGCSATRRRATSGVATHCTRARGAASAGATTTVRPWQLTTRRADVAAAGTDGSGRRTSIAPDGSPAAVPTSLGHRFAAVETVRRRASTRVPVGPLGL